MCPSTDDQQILSIDFCVKDRLVATLKIACVCPIPDDVLSNITPPDYVDMDNSLNIHLIKEKSEIDPNIGIQVYCGSDPYLSPILLSEETEYEIEVESKADGVGNQLKSPSDADGTLMLKTSIFNSDNNKKSYRLYSKSYVGKGFFDIEYYSDTISIPFEMRSKKIEYLTHYPQMLAEIAEISLPAILDHKSPLYRNYGLSPKTESDLYEDFLILEYVFEKLDLESSYECVRRNPYSVLKTVKTMAPSGYAYSIDPSDIVHFSNGSCWNTSSVPGLKAIPESIPNTVYEETLDTAENRLVKDLLIKIQDRIRTLTGSFLMNQDGYVHDSLLNMSLIIDRMLSDRWLEDVKRPYHEPFESTVLLKRQGYRELFEAYIVLGMSIEFKMEEGPELIRGHEKKVYETYEYWCYLKLYQCLYEMSENKPPLRISDKNRAVTFRKPIIFEISRGSGEYIVDYYYNKNFDPDVEEFRSYSIRLRPDFTLVITNNGNKSIINFDSKYKVKLKDPSEIAIDDSEMKIGCWEYDIYKMHTYRDALLKSMGSYILYPGTGGWKYYVKPPNEQFWDDREDIVLPSVGAIPLVPGRDNDSLKRAIGIMLDRLGSQSGTMNF